MAGDASYNSVSLLLHGDGANDSTTFTDNSPSPKTPTVNGNAKISTAQSKFGGASMYFDGSGDFLSYATNTAFDMGSSDFTIEAWVRTATTTGTHAIIGLANGSAANTNYSFQLLQNGTSWLLNVFIGLTVYGGAAGTISADTWTHIALVRSGTNLLTFIGGVLTRTDAIGGSAINYPSGAVLHIGQVQGFYPWNGYIDDLRITKGVARYTADFTVPSLAFSSGLGEVEGIVYDDTGTPCARTVRLYRRDTGAFVSGGTSDASTGAYRLAAPTLDEVQRIVLDDSGGTLYNDIIDRVIPA